EHSLGKGEVDSSILSSSTISLFQNFQSFTTRPRNDNACDVAFALSLYLKSSLQRAKLNAGRVFRRCVATTVLCCAVLCCAVAQLY
ncbi:hypothetical protein, partial [Acetobacter orientalis]